MAQAPQKQPTNNVKAAPLVIPLHPNRRNDGGAQTPIFVFAGNQQAPPPVKATPSNQPKSRASTSKVTSKK